MVIWNQLKKNHPREMTEEVGLHLSERDPDRLQRQFNTMLDGVRNLAQAPH
jgi:hypothetical protein